MTVGGLSTRDIDDMLKGVKIFKGTYPSDFIPLTSTKHTQAYIINTDRDSSPGSHWVGLIISNDNCYYFDSFGF